MKEKLFNQTIQYLDSLYDEGSLGPDKVAQLARFSLDLGKIRPSDKNSSRLPRSHSYSSSGDSEEILSDIIQNNWNS